jgi:DnaJ-class molecular chaperone
VVVNVGRFLDDAARSLVDGRDVIFPDGQIATPDGPAETCKKCGGTGKGDPEETMLREPPSYGRDGCSECRGIGQTRGFRIKVTPPRRKP